MRVVRLDKSTSPTTKEEKDRWKEFPYRSYLGAVGSVMLATAPQLAHAYGQLARFNDAYGKQHWDALMELLGYMRANRDRNKMYIGRGAGNQLSCYCDADWNAGYDSTSTSGWIVFLGATRYHGAHACKRSGRQKFQSGPLSQLQRLTGHSDVWRVIQWVKTD